MSYNDWLESQQVTMFYECTATFPDGTTHNFVQKKEFDNDKQANEAIENWNRLSKITNGIKWNFRRLL